MDKVIKNCLITNSDAKVLKEYCIDKSDPLYKEYKGFNTSVNLEASNVYSMCYGQVCMISGDKKSGYDVAVRVNQNQVVRYGNLSSVDVAVNDIVDISNKIGEVKHWVRFEYMSTKVKNQYSFRVGNTQMYKDNPMKIFDSDNAILQGDSPQYYQSAAYDLIPQDEYPDYPFEFNYEAN